MQKEYIKKGNTNEQEWSKLLSEYRLQYPELYNQLNEDYSKNYFEKVKKLTNPFIEQKQLSTREASGIVLNQLAEYLPLFGGSADLASSNKTYLKNKGDFSVDSYKGQNIWFGIREFFMGAAMNGIALHGGLISFGATFFVFSDYLKSAIRSASLMKLPVLYVMTHDSIAVGEDGPTHQPIEQLAGFRATPNLNVFRPADANETFNTYQYILKNPTTPNLLVLSRQELPNKTPICSPIEKGAYVVKPAEKSIDIVFVATGSEVSLAFEIAEILKEFSIQIVSAPSLDIFAEQTSKYKESIIPYNVPSFSLEMGSTFGWHEFVDYSLGIDQYGKSAPADKLLEEYSFTSQQLADRIRSILKGLSK